jgi:hypothetical protein
MFCKQLDGVHGRGCIPQSIQQVVSEKNPVTYVRDYTIGAILRKYFSSQVLAEPEVSQNLFI